MRVSGRWISIDGVEGSGKTTVAKALSHEIAGAVLVPEFSSTAVGRALWRQVKIDPRIFAEAPRAESLFFMGDYFYQVEARILPAVRRGNTVVSDRGYLSKWAYQAAVLRQGLPKRRAYAFMNMLLRESPLPTVCVFLDCPLELLRRRIVVRDGACSKHRWKFIQMAHEEFDRLTRTPTFPLEIVKIQQAQSRSTVLANVIDAARRRGVII